MSAAHAALRDAFGQYLDRITPHSGACPDCDADLRVIEEHPGVFRMTIMHDATCPTFARIEAGR